MSATVKDPDRFGPEHVGRKWSVEVMSLLRFDGDRICYEADFHAPGARNRSLGIDRGRPADGAATRYAGARGWPRRRRPRA